MIDNVPPYLIGLAVGDLRSHLTDARTGVFTEPSQLDRDIAELSDTGYMVNHGGRPVRALSLGPHSDRPAFQPQVRAGFLADLRANLIKGDRALEAKLQLDRWVQEAGLPDNAVHVRSATLARIDAALARVNAGAPLASIDASRWSTQEWLRLLNGLPRRQTAGRLAELDRAFGLSASGNAYLRSAWLVLAIGNRYDPAVPSIEQFLPSVGRNLLVVPVYRALKAQGDWGMPIARRVFERAGRLSSVTAAAITTLLG